jgi:hypothetical protein
MDGLPPQTDFTTIIGRRVTMVRITKHQVDYILNDEKPTRPDAWIAIESSSLIYTDRESKAIKIDDFRTSGGLLCLLLGLTIENASRRADGGLVLNMSDGITLQVVIDTTLYEAVVLHIGDVAIVG